MRTVDFCVEGNQKRELWGTLTVPGSVQGPAIVMTHGFLGFKDWAFFPWLGSFFAEAGFPVVRFNFSGSGMGPQADGPFQDLEAFQEDSITKQVEDLLSVLHCLTRGQLEPDLPAQKKLFLWGHSRGGAICLLAAARTASVKGVVTWSTISRVNRYLYEVKQAWRKQGFHVFESSRTGQTLRYSTAFLEDVEKWGKDGDLPTYLHNLDIPIFLIHGSDDDSVPATESESLAAIHPSARLAILAGANHKFNATHPFGDPSAVLVKAAQKTVEFYQVLGEQG